MNRSVSVVVVVLVVGITVAAAGGPTALADVTDTDSIPSEFSSTTAPETDPQPATATMDGSGTYDHTTFEIRVHGNGSATWTFQYEQRFDPENESEERAAFEAFAEEFEANETGFYDRFTQQADSLVETGADVTDREMNATDFQRSATIRDEFGTIDDHGTRGVVELSFRWDGFADVEDGILTVGDVFQNIYITEDQSIEIVAGDGLTFDAVEPSDAAEYRGNAVANASSVRWTGEYQFLDGHPRAVLLQDGGTDSRSASSLIGAETWHLAVGALVAVVLAVGAVGYYRTRDSAPDGATATGNPDETETSSDPDAPDDSDASADAAPLPEEELLTDEDRVVELIRENGGRMKQVKIVEETGWSKSKVSMLLSDMEDDGTVSKLRVGRENIISLEGFEPEATKSPFEE